jgi:uncharacterized protein (DUF1499 family)
MKILVFVKLTSGLLHPNTVHPMKILGLALAFFTGVAAIVLIVGQLGFLQWKAPGDLGVQQGRLKRPALTPNSVSSQADLYPDHPQRDYARIEPIHFQGDGLLAMSKIAGILKSMSHTVLVTQEQGYLYAQCSTQWLKFTDDVEFWLDTNAGVIQVRSASRLGRKDFGVNRERIETIRAQFAKN